MLRKKTLLILADILLNVFLPICVGVIIYSFPVKQFIRNYIPDGLWAYALTSAILIIWSRKIQLFWLFSVAILFIVFEILQSYHIIVGTGDIKDILIYFAFGIIALSLNKFFKQIFIKQKTVQNETKD